MSTSDSQFYERLEALVVKNGSVCIGNKSKWLDLKELIDWARSKSYKVITKHSNRYVRIEKTTC